MICLLNSVLVVYDREKEGLRMTFISMATFIVALAFAFVSIYIAKILLRVSTFLKTLGQTMDKVEQQMDKTVHEVEQLIVEAETSATDVENKLIATDGLFQSINNVGEATSIIGKDLYDRTEKYGNDSTLPGTAKFVRAIQWAEYADILFKSWQRGKNATL